MIITSRPSLRTQTHLSQTCKFSKLDTCGAVAKCISVPMLKECCGVDVQEAGKPPNSVCGAISTMEVVPAGDLALVLIATHVRGDANHGLVDIAVTKATVPIARAVLDLVVRL